jgi:hypothetical protein
VVPVDASADPLVLVDGGSSLELVDPAVTNVSAVVVAPRGTPRRRLRELASDYVEGGLFGVVLVDVRSSLRAGAGRRARPPRAAKQPAAGTVAVPEPERA